MRVDISRILPDGVLLISVRGDAIVFGNTEWHTEKVGSGFTKIAPPYIHCPAATDSGAYLARYDADRPDSKVARGLSTPGQRTERDTLPKHLLAAMQRPDPIGLVRGGESRPELLD